MTTSPQKDALRDLLAPVVAGSGLVLEGVSVTTIGRRRRIQVVVDLDEGETGGVPVDSVAEVSREVSQALDDTGVMGQGTYVLEVSSPGVDRPLTERRHWARARGRLVRTTLSGGDTVTGRVDAVDENGVTLDGTPHPWDQMVKGMVEVEFSPPEDDAGRASRSGMKERG